MALANTMDANEEIVKLMIVQLRRSAATQSEVITELDSVGFRPIRIAELLGATPNVVNVTLNKTKKRLERTAKVINGGGQS